MKRRALEVAQNPATPPNVLANLARFGDWITRKGVASNPSAPGEVLKRLAKDYDYTVRTTGESPLLTQGEVQRSGDLRLARALWKRSGEAVPLRLLLKLVKGEELTGEEVSEGRKALALAELAGL